MLSGKLCVRKVSSFLFTSCLFRFTDTSVFFFIFCRIFCDRDCCICFAYKSFRGKLTRGRVKFIDLHMRDVWPLSCVRNACSICISSLMKQICHPRLFAFNEHFLQVQHFHWRLWRLGLLSKQLREWNKAWRGREVRNEQDSGGPKRLRLQTESYSKTVPVFWFEAQISN